MLGKGHGSQYKAQTNGKEKGEMLRGEGEGEGDQIKFIDLRIERFFPFFIHKRIIIKLQNNLHY